MKYGLISLLPLQIARLLELVRTVEAVRLDGEPRPQWALLIRGRGFTPLLRDEPLMSPYLLRTHDPTVPRRCDSWCARLPSDTRRALG